MFVLFRAGAPLAKSSRDSIAIQVSPRDRFVIWLAVHDHQEQGAEPHEAMVRVRRSLGFTDIEKRVAEIANKKHTASDADFSAAKVDAKIFRDDLERLMTWIDQASESGQMAEATGALEEQWRDALASSK